MVSFINVTDEMKEYVKRVNDEQRKIKVKQFKEDGKLLSFDDFVMVRVTNGMPRMGYIEASYRYLDPIEMDSPMSSLNDYTFKLDSSFDLKYLRARKTLHWTLNSRVENHSGGNFDNRDFVIVEPFAFHINDDNLVRFAENDTYFKGDIKLSDQATILVSKVKYEQLKDDVDFGEMLNNYDVRIYDGDEKVALYSVLLEKGYIFGRVGAWGFDGIDDFEKLFIMSRDRIAKDLGKDTANHAYTDEYREEREEESANMLKSTHFLYETISKISGISNGQNAELIEKLRKISVPLAYGKVYYYMEESSKAEEDDFFDLRNRNERKLVRKMVPNFDPLSPSFYEISENDFFNYCVLHCNDEYFCVPNKNVIELVGLGVIKEATDIVNQIVVEEAHKYREEKDMELMGRVVPKK